MHPVVFAAFDEICRGRVTPGARVLEIGAMPAEDTLLNLPTLREAAVRVGANLAMARTYPGLELVQVAADGLAAFADASFDAVLCNSVLEHDARFWHTLDGVLRVARPGALIAIGVPGYADLPPAPLIRLARRAIRLPLVARLFARAVPGWDAATPTLVVHNYPGDYYRFSEQAMREVLLAGCRDVAVRVVMRPPRIIGFGWRQTKPGAEAARATSG
jgi:SAM-dependent methyltransferase